MSSQDERSKNGPVFQGRDFSHRTKDWTEGDQDRRFQLLVCLIGGGAGKFLRYLDRYIVFTAVDGGKSGEGASELRLNVTHVFVPLVFKFPWPKRNVQFETRGACLPGATRAKGYSCV
jgi:hypothetical protein